MTIIELKVVLETTGLKVFYYNAPINTKLSEFITINLSYENVVYGDNSRIFTTEIINIRYATKSKNFTREKELEKLLLDNDIQYDKIQYSDSNPDYFYIVYTVEL